MNRPPTAPYVTPRPLSLLFVALLCGVAGTTAHADEHDLEVAKMARPSVVRIRWRDARFHRITSERNAIVIRSDGLLVMGGPPPSRRGTLTAKFSDGSESRATLLAWDERTALSLLRVNRTRLRPLVLRTESTGGPSKEGAAKEAQPKAPPKRDGRPHPLKPAGSVRPAPPGLRVVMVTGNGDVAIGAVRGHGRTGTVTDPDTRGSRSTTRVRGSRPTSSSASSRSSIRSTRARRATPAARGSD